MATAVAQCEDDRPDAARRSRRSRSSTGPVSVTNQSAITTGTKLLLNIDLRTAAGRRYRDLCRAFEGEVGGVLTESDRAIIRQDAALTLKSEQMQEALIRGEVVDENQLIRLSGAAKRLLATLARKAKARKPDVPTLASYLEEREREATAE
jgi:hypothetical protein